MVLAAVRKRRVPFLPRRRDLRQCPEPVAADVPSPALGQAAWTTVGGVGNPLVAPMRLRCQFSTPVARTDLDDYVRHLEIGVVCFDADGSGEYTVGRLAMDQVLWADAAVDGVSLSEVCDNDSQGLHEVHSILTKGGQEFRPDLRIKEITSHVLFLYGAVFHPSIHPYRQGILQAAFTVFGQEALPVMWTDP